MAERALFLDRDGVINVDTGYVFQPEQITFVNGIFRLARVANVAGYRIVIVTNQAGIGRGYYTESDFHFLMGWMQQCFEVEGVPILAYYFCPHHPEHGIGEYRTKCECRKPAPGMLLRAQNDYAFDMKSSIMIGDKYTDMAAGQAASVGRLWQIAGDKLHPSAREVESVEALLDVIEF